MKLHAAVKKVKGALSSKDYISSLTHYHLKQGKIFAANGALVASAPVDEALEHVVPADELEKALNIFGEDAEYIWSAETLLVKKSRKRMTVRLLAPEQVDLIEPVAELHKVPKRFISGMRSVRPFISDDATRPWALTAWLHRNQYGSHVWTATNNMTVAEADAESSDDKLAQTIDCQIPNFAVDYVLARQEAVIGFGCTENKATFAFDDGSQITTQLFSVKMPEQVSKMVADCYDAPTQYQPLNSDWCDAYKTVVQISPEEIVFKPNLMSAGKKQATMEVEIETQRPRDITKPDSYWNPKFLTPVVDAATKIDFGNYPNACKFYGDGVRGLMAGKVVK